MGYSIKDYIIDTTAKFDDKFRLYLPKEIVKRIKARNDEEDIFIFEKNGKYVIGGNKDFEGIVNEGYNPFNKIQIDNQKRINIKNLIQKLNPETNELKLFGDKNKILISKVELPNYKHFSNYNTTIENIVIGYST